MVISVLAFFITTALLSVRAFGMYFHDTFAVDFSQPYITTDSTGALTMRYNNGGVFSDVRGSTDLSVANDETGTAYVRIEALNNVKRQSYGNKAKRNVINSGKAVVTGQDFAKSAFHSAERISHGIVFTWEYTCK